MPYAAIDFETYYDEECSAKLLGSVAYTHHPKFNAYMVAILSEDGVSYVGDPLEAPWDKIKDHEWLSHNAQFDQACYNWLIRTHDSTLPIPLKWHGTAAMCAYLQCDRKLASATKILLGRELSKEVRDTMKGKNLSDYKLDPDFIEKLMSYCMSDARACLDLWLKFSHLWPEWERQVSNLTIEASTLGFHVNETLVTDCIKKLELVLWESTQKIPWSNDAPILSANQISNACRAAGIPSDEIPESFSEDDKSCEAFVEKYSDKVAFIGAVRDYRKANILLEKYKTLRKRTINGRFSYEMMYCGAPHTRRWTGGRDEEKQKTKVSRGFNVQNLPREPQFGCDLRAALVPGPGHKLICADFSQIEPRVLLWIVKDNATLAHIRNGMALYEAHARATMGWTGGKLKDENKNLYALAKARVLALGYGCGPERFVEAARVMAGYVVKPEDSERLVNGYRTANPKITALWEQMDKAIKMSINSDFELELPSKNVIQYFNVRKQKLAGRWQITAETCRGQPPRNFYGGKLVENLVQATARDLLADAMLRVAQLPFVRVVCHVHDEIICETPDTIADKNFKLICDEMRKPPSWAKGVPLDVEAQITDHYVK